MSVSFYFAFPACPGHGARLALRRKQDDDGGARWLYRPPNSEPSTSELTAGRVAGPAARWHRVMFPPPVRTPKQKTA